ncbi:DUF554 domain-containing protein [Calothrix sp. FACHB-1219]|uniref:DUF554 family protein n=1 Tax=unclassified Calothrix TaxID=2619626 RepID=UPI001685F652|nr:DUF554 family protein [Calothrix sp. FACHB-168]MBD2204148.1 DUF554 domain-containing protein [Calothrix sp. FACHB-168]MBD2220962.1 DUF554 domain-containing protein [Calothrix sp. FACHB-1219]
MTLDFWVRTNGTWINAISIIAGTISGLLLKKHLPAKMQLIITQGVALITIFIGLQMAGSLTQVKNTRVDGIVLGLIAIAVGGVLGEWWKLEERLYSLGDFIKALFPASDNFTDGFVASSLLFCVGPMALIGSFNNGLTGNNTILMLKATMDGISAIALSSSYGIGVGFSAIILLLYQGTVSLIAGLLIQVLPNPTNHPCLLLITGVGGLTILGLGLNLLVITQIRVASLLPSLLIAPLLYLLTIK